MRSIVRETVLAVVLTLSLTLASGYSTAALAANGSLRTHILSLNYSGKLLNVRVGVQNTEGAPLGDILYFHGFADRLDNHQPLFDAWAQAGFRVISFDLPSHGKNSGSYNDLNHFSFKDLAELGARVEQDTKPATSRPLILAGWSTGGLLVVRMLQESWTFGLSRPVAGAILFAPGVSVRKFPWTFGNGQGEVTEGTLTHNPNPPHFGPVHPTTPFWSHLVYGFAPRLAKESLLSQSDVYPQDIPTLVFTGGDQEDRYAKAWVVRQWVRKQNESRQSDGNPLIVNISCPHSAHEMDNELASFGGVEVRNSAAYFARTVVAGLPTAFTSSPETYGAVCSLESQSVK
jgi:pimeloyl-ACP methyl ester carboxylesterase